MTEGAVVIDYAGPWKCSRNVHTGEGDMGQQMPFELYTVDATGQPIHTSGGHEAGHDRGAGLWLCGLRRRRMWSSSGPSRENDQLGPWLRKVHEQHALIMSVCTGAFRVAQAGLLDGKPATTHQRLAPAPRYQYPRIAVRSSRALVESDPLILTAGGLSSGIDSALHVVELYYGPKVAQATADYMEYQGQGWKTNTGAGEPKQVLRPYRSPTATTRRSGRAPSCRTIRSPSPKMPVLLHLAWWMAVQGTIDAPTESMVGEPLDEVRVDHGGIHFTLASDNGPVDFSGTMTAKKISAM